MKLIYTQGKNSVTLYQGVGGNTFHLPTYEYYLPQMFFACDMLKNIIVLILFNKNQYICVTKCCKLL